MITCLEVIIENTVQKISRHLNIPLTSKLITDESEITNERVIFYIVYLNSTINKLESSRLIEVQTGRWTGGILIRIYGKRAVKSIFDQEGLPIAHEIFHHYRSKKWPKEAPDWFKNKYISLYRQYFGFVPENINWKTVWEEYVTEREVAEFAIKFRMKNALIRRYHYFLDLLHRYDLPEEAKQEITAYLLGIQDHMSEIL